MSKYNENSHMEAEGALTKIAAMLEAPGKVLEFGPARGYFTRHLQALEYSVSIIELDAQDAEEAGKYADASFVGDIEAYEWKEFYKDQKFDYIIFADVLEHLYDPQEVLIQVKSFLEDDGKILISLPNIAHNSVVLNLIHDCFPYSDLGILDNTHIRFFTLPELIKEFAKIDLGVVAYEPVVIPVAGTELPYDYADVPISVADYLRKRGRGEVYQNVFSLQPGLKTEDGVFFNPKTKSKKGYYEYFFESPQGEFELASRGVVDRKDQIQSLILQKGKLKVRLDPLDSACMLINPRVSFRGEDLSIKENNADYLYDGKYYFLTNDAQISVYLPEDVKDGETLEFLYDHIQAEVEFNNGLIQHLIDRIQSKHCIELYSAKSYEDFSEKCRISYEVGSLQEKLSITHELEEGKYYLRIDPLNAECWLTEINLELKGDGSKELIYQNGQREGDGLCFMHDDPNLIYEVVVQEPQVVEFSARVAASETINNEDWKTQKRKLYKTLQDKISNLENNAIELRGFKEELEVNLQTLEANLQALINSTSWKLTAPIRGILRILGKITKKD